MRGALVRKLFKITNILRGESCVCARLSEFSSSLLSPLALRFSFLPPPRFSFYFVLPLCAFFLFFPFFFLKRGQTVNSFVSLMHELRSCIAPRLPYTHRPSTTSVSPLPIAHPLPPVLASPLHPVEIPYSHTRVCKIQSPLLSACKILPGALGRNLHFAKNRSGTTTALKLLNHMSVSRFFFLPFFAFCKWEKKRSFRREKIDSFMNEEDPREGARASHDNGRTSRG